MANRRTFLKAGGVALAGAAGIAAFGTQRGSAVEIGTFDITDGTVTTDNGVLTELTVDLDYKFDWQGLDFNPVEAVVTLDASGDGGDNWTGVFTGTHSVSGYSGGPVTGSGTSDDLVDALDGVDFDQTMDGQDKDTELDFKLTVTLNPSDDGGSVFASTEDGATVKVKNLAPGIGIGGDGEFNGEGAEVYPHTDTFAGNIYDKNGNLVQGKSVELRVTYHASYVELEMDLSEYVPLVSSGAPLNGAIGLDTDNDGTGDLQLGWLPGINGPTFAVKKNSGSGWGPWANYNSEQAVLDAEENGGVVTFTVAKDNNHGETYKVGFAATAGGEEESAVVSNDPPNFWQYQGDWTSSHYYIETTEK